MRKCLYVLLVSVLVPCFCVAFEGELSEKDIFSEVLSNELSHVFPQDQVDQIINIFEQEEYCQNIMKAAIALSEGNRIDAIGLFNHGYEEALNKGFSSELLNLLKQMFQIEIFRFDQFDNDYFMLERQCDSFSIELCKKKHKNKKKVTFNPVKFVCGVAKIVGAGVATIFTGGGAASVGALGVACSGAYDCIDSFSVQEDEDFEEKMREQNRRPF